MKRAEAFSESGWMGRYIYRQECVCVCVCTCVRDGETSPQSPRKDWGFGGTPIKQGRIHGVAGSRFCQGRDSGPGSGQWSSCLSFALRAPPGGGGVGMLQAVAGRAVLPCRIHRPAHSF